MKTESNKFSIKRAVEYLARYWDTYDRQPTWGNLNFDTFMNDALYGLGVAIDDEKYLQAPGFRRFKRDLYERLKAEQTEDFKHTLRRGKC